jgi:hypothetical protein
MGMGVEERACDLPSIRRILSHIELPAGAADEFECKVIEATSGPSSINFKVRVA